MTPVMGYTQMKDSGIPWIGKYPGHWKCGKVKNVFFSTKTIVGDEVDKYERLALTLNGVVKRSKTDSNGLQPEKFETYQILRENELVFKLIDLQNTATSRIGRSPYVGIISPAYIVLHERNDCSSKYAEYYFLSMWMHHVFNQLGADGVRSSIGASALRTLPFLLPPESEQETIATYLDTQCAKIDEIIAETKTSIENYKQWKVSVIYEAVTKGLDPDVDLKGSGLPWIGSIPQKWQVTRVRDGFTQKKSKAQQCDPVVLSLGRNGVKIRDMDKAEGQFAASYFDYNPVAIDDILINPMALSSGDNCSLSKVEGVISPAYINLRYKPGFYPNYYHYYFKYQYWCMAFFAHGKGVSFDNRWTLNNETLMKYPLTKPPFEEQTIIATYLDTRCAKIDGLISAKQALIADLESYKKSLIYEAVTGKRRVG